jgi:hypothetical protein
MDAVDMRNKYQDLNRNLQLAPAGDDEDNLPKYMLHPPRRR